MQVQFALPGGERPALTGFFGALDLLTQLLGASGVLVRQGARVGLTPAFREDLRFRDLIETKIEFCALLLPGLAEGFTRYRSLMVYARGFEAMEMQGIDMQEVRLDFPIFLVVARRPA